MVPVLRPKPGKHDPPERLPAASKALVARVLVAIAFAFQISGCLYIKNGKTQNVQFESTPAGARVVVNGVPHGSTPTTVTLSRCTNYKVVVEKPGYSPADVLLSRALYGPDSLTFVADGVLILPLFVDG